VASGTPGPSQGGASIIAGHPSIQSADGRFQANLHGVMQWDAAYYFQKSPGPIASDFRRSNGGDAARARDLNSGTNFRRARIGIDGRLFGDFDYNVLFEFGGAGTEDEGHIQELWLQYSGLKPFRFRVGAYPPPIGLEDQNSTNGMPFLERPAISDIARGIAGGDFREGATLLASRSRWFAAASLTTRVVNVGNSASLGAGQTFDSQLGGILRVAAIPIQGDNYLVHVGAHGSRVFSVGDTAGPPAANEIVPTRFAVQFQERPELRVDGTRFVGTGSINARHVNEGGLELAGQIGPFYAQGEYEWLRIERRDSPLDNPKFHGFYVEGGLMLTGERRKYNTGTFAFDGPPVNHPFDLRSGTFGALELAGRYSTVDLNYHGGIENRAAPADGVRGGEQKIIAAGLNWYLNPAVRFMLDYQHVSIDRLSPSAATYLTPAGVQIGQHYNTVEVRSQLAF
jgi:phosphate-selective porin OprO/OprP